MKFAFVGPTYQSRGLNVDAQRTMNVYPESDESGSGKSIAALVGRPGLSLFCTLPQTPVRGLFAGENRLFAVGGSHFYEVTSGTPSDRSTLSGATTIGNDNNPVYAILNGNQLGLASAGDFYCDSGPGPVAVRFTPGKNAGTPDSPLGGAGTSTTSLTIGTGSVTLTTNANLAFGTADVGENNQGDRIRIYSTASPGNYMVGTCTAYNSTTGALTVNVTQTEGSGTFASWTVIMAVPAVQCTYLDAYGMIQQAYNSRYWNLSQLLDLTTFDPLDYAQKEGYPDSLAAILADHEEVWLWGIEGTAEVWRANGSSPPTFPYSRDPGAFIHYGCIASNSPVRLMDGVAWLAADMANGSSRGGPFAVYAQGYKPRRVSTHAIEEAWAGYSKISDAVSYSMIENGHHLWVITFPTANHTWVYDATEQLWHERGWWNGTGWDRERGLFHAYVDLGTGPKHYVGDWQSGKIYVMSPSSADDAGTTIYWQRIAPYIADEEQRIAHYRFQLDAGAGLTCWLEFSDDFSASWSNKKYPRPPIAIPKGGQRYTFGRLGAGRHRLYRVTGTGGGNGIALTNAYLRAAGAEA